MKTKVMPKTWQFFLLEKFIAKVASVPQMKKGGANKSMIVI